MDISAIKEMIDWFLMRACLLALAALSGLFLFAVLSRALVRLKFAAKRYGWPIVTLFIVFSSWATYTAFPTAEEKNGNVANVGMLPITNTNYQFGNGEHKFHCSP